MRLLLALFFFILMINPVVFSYDFLDEEKRVGLTYQRINTPYRDFSSTELVLPYFRYKKSFWDIEGVMARAIFFNYDDFQTGFEFNFEPVGYGQAQEGAILELNKTSYSFPIGIYHLHHFKYVDCLLNVLISFVGGNYGLIRRLTLQKDYLLFKDIFFRPYLQMEFLSQSYVHYYYGVEEATSSFDSYIPGSALNYNIGSYLSFEMFKKIFLNISINYSKLHGAITQSPIITRSQLIIWSVSISMRI